MIIIEPMSGLCNRMRSIGSAINLSRKLGHNLYVFWVMTPEINCKLSDLFIIPEDIKEIYECRRGIASKIIKGLSKAFFSLPNNVFLDQKRMHGIPEESMGEAYYKEMNALYFNTYLPFYGKNNPYQHFRPRKDIQTIIDSYDTKELIGLHIRRGDNAQNIVYKLNSPLHMFYEEINRRISCDVSAKFFAATDDSSIDEELMKKYPGRMIIHPKKSRDRNNPDAIKDAVVDLYCLANCTKLIGTYWSAFTDAAWRINGVERIEIKKERV